MMFWILFCIVILSFGLTFYLNYEQNYSRKLLEINRNVNDVGYSLESNLNEYRRLLQIQNLNLKTILEQKTTLFNSLSSAELNRLAEQLQVNDKQMSKEEKIGYLAYVDTVHIVNNTKNLAIDSFIEALNEQEEYEDVIIDKSEALSKISEDTLLIITDTHKKNFVEVPELLDKTENIVVVDHHRKSADFIENATLTFHEAYASSAAELVTEIIEYATNDIELNQIEAEGLYAGIMVDTKNFTFKTGVRTFEAAAYLRKYGIDIIRVKKWFQSDLESYNVIADIVKKAEIINESIGISEYEEEDKNANLICAKAADELLTISNITASFVIGNQGDKICISGRSIGDINVQIIMEKLGGGGHITLAGAQLEGMTIDEARHELIIRINEYFTEIS